jgi:tRNA nucleotidyltransferase (CCA-adding enzyme)
VYTAAVEPISPRSRADRLRELPDGVLEVVHRLEAAGHAAYLVGGCVRDLLLGIDVADYDVATSASPEAVLDLLPRSIPIGLRHGTVMVPTADRPVDVTSFRAGPDLAADLAHRDFTIDAIAFDCRSGSFVDPFDGRSDLAARRLRAVGSADERFREDPLRALRAARLVVALDLEPAPGLADAMARARPGLAGVARERVRGELERLFTAENPAPGLELLRRSGIEADLAPDTAPDAIALVAALPRDLDLRLAAWLRGTRAGRILARLRFPRRTSRRVLHLLRLHPIGASLNPKRDAAVRKLIKQARTENLDALCTLRREELRLRGADAAAELAQLDRVEAAIARVQRAGALALRRVDLAVSGNDVMEILGCGPGRAVGRALAHLTEAVIEDPAANTPARLRELIEEWADEHGLR